MSLDGYPIGEEDIEVYLGFPQPIQGLFMASKPTTFDSTKRLAFSLTHQEVRRGTIAQKADRSKVWGRKRKFGKEAKAKARKSSKKKREVIRAFIVAALSVGTTSGGSPKCKECGYHHHGAC